MPFPGKDGAVPLNHYFENFGMKHFAITTNSFFYKRRIWCRRLAQIGDGRLGLVPRIRQNMVLGKRS